MGLHPALIKIYIMLDNNPLTLEIELLEEISRLASDHAYLRWFDSVLDRILKTSNQTLNVSRIILALGVPSTPYAAASAIGLHLPAAVIPAAARASDSSQGPWVCGGCTEQLEGQFTTCWKCGGERDA